MSKRFTDTEKWKKPFIRSLKAPYRLLWFYICDDCDHAGIWHVDIEVAKIRTGEKFTKVEALKFFGEKVISFDGGEKWFIPSFIEFQYPSGLNPANKVHNSAICILKKYELIDEHYKPLPSPIQGAKDKEQEQDMEQEEEKDLNITFKYFWDLYDKKIDAKLCETKWKALTNFERQAAIDYLPAYKLSQPDPKYRRNPEVFINRKTWNNQLIKTNGAHKPAFNSSKQAGAEQLRDSLKNDLRSHAGRNENSQAEV